MSMTTISLRPTLNNLPETAQEPIINQLFAPQLLEVLGFDSQDIYSQYSTGNGTVDIAARRKNGEDVFLHTKANPYLLVELKGRDINLSEGTRQYQSTVKQLKQYLLAPGCQSVKWGIITNSCHIQLFRKHGKTIFPATKCHELNDYSIDEIATLIKRKIEQPTKALTVTVYNNKGGVGKTTTTVNLAGILTLIGKKVLVVDFDPNQQDLTSALGLSLTKEAFYNALTDKHISLKGTICKYSYLFRNKKIELSFDVIPADQKLADCPEVNLKKELPQLGNKSLFNKLEFARHEYDYILIDSPPNWRLFSKLAVYAADVVLIPTKHNNLFSIENAAMAIKSFLPEIQQEKGDGSPVALPIFFNGEKITPYQLSAVQQEMNNIIRQVRKDDNFDLLPYFFPRYTKSKKDLHIPQVPSYANIASSAFSRVPAVYRDRSAFDYYKNLVKEYFLQ